MSEENPPNEFQQQVLSALEDAEANDFCFGCGEQGSDFAGWTLPPEPGLLPGVSGGGLLVATLICRRCGCCKTFALSALGVRYEGQRLFVPPAQRLIH